MTKLVRYTIIISILLTPIYGFGEFLGYLGLLPYTRKEILTPLYLKMLKDFTFLLPIILGSILFLINFFKITYITLLVLMFFLYYVLYNLISISKLELIVSGIRVMLPIISAIFLKNFIDIQFYYRVARTLLLVYILSVIFGVIQFFYGEPIYGLIFDSFFFRVTSFFVNPSSFGIFVVIFTYIYISFYLNNKISFKSLALITISGILVILTASGISIVSYFIVIGLILKNAVKTHLLKIFIIYLATIIIVLVMIKLQDISNREDIYMSGLERLNILLNFFEDSSIQQIIFGKGFGIGTNTLFIVFPEIAEVYGQIPDSVFLSLLYQSGILGVLGFIMLNIFAFTKLIKAENRLAFSIPIILIAGLTSNILELWPVNILYSLLLALSFRKITNYKEF